MPRVYTANFQQVTAMLFIRDIHPKRGPELTQEKQCTQELIIWE